MKTVKYVPTICKGDDPSYSGHVELRMPSFNEKFDLLEKAGVELDEDSKVIYKTAGKLAMIRKMVEITEPYYVSIELKRNSDGAELKSYDDLQNEPDAHSVLTEVSVQIMQGMKLGKV